MGEGGKGRIDFGFISCLFSTSHVCVFQILKGIIEGGNKVLPILYIMRNKIRMWMMNMI